MFIFAAMMKTNFHTHSLFCDGKAPLEDFVRTAVDNDFQRLGFSGHAPVPFENGFAIKKSDLQEYCSGVLELKERYKDQIELFLGLEADYIPGRTTSFKTFREPCNLDYVIGSVHLVSNGISDELWFIDGPKSEIYDFGLEQLFDNDIHVAVEAYFMQVIQMIKLEKPEIIGHIDKIKMHNNERFFSTNDPWYRKLMIEALEAAQSINAVVEINPRGLYKGRCDDLFPGKEWLPIMKEMGLRVMLNSDAHHPDDLMKEYDTCLNAVKEAGYERMAVWGENGVEEVGI